MVVVGGLETLNSRDAWLGLMERSAAAVDDSGRKVLGTSRGNRLSAMEPPPTEVVPCTSWLKRGFQGERRGAIG